MIERKLAAPALFASLMLASCAGVDLVAAGKPADLGDGISVVPATAWARVRAPGIDPILTIDGVGLGEVRYYTGVKPGDPIFKVAGLSSAEIGTYSANMLPNDIMELFVGNLTKAGGQDVRVSGLKPAKFGAAQGFRFDIAFVTKDGLNMQGEALAAQRAGKLDILIFTAPEEYYFAHRQPDADQLFATLQASG